MSKRGGWEASNGGGALRSRLVPYQQVFTAAHCASNKRSSSAPFRQPIIFCSELPSTSSVTPLALSRSMSRISFYENSWVHRAI